MTAVFEAGKTYTLHEEVAPKGYTLAGDVPFTVSTDGKTDIVVMRDDTTNVTVEKVDESGKAVAGATLQVLDKDGCMNFVHTVVEEWVTTEKVHTIGKLTDGLEYTLHEKTAPKGYVLAADVKFTISTDGKTDTVKMIEKPTKVQFSKKSVTGEDEVPGTTLIVTDEKGNVIDKWVSTDKPHLVTAVFEAGKTYILHEEVAPSGYSHAEDIDFKVSTDGKTDIVVMNDDTTTITVEKVDDGKLKFSR